MFFFIEECKTQNKMHKKHAKIPPTLECDCVLTVST